jgi:hypothetical protein
MELLQYLEEWSQVEGSPWETQSGYLLMRTEPATQVADDAEIHDNFGYPAFPLVDLHTMEVLDADCVYADSWQACIDSHL